uniref:Inositol-pentakisphosphate 2-kinase n=1 Tax=Panagrellus redivivus TaxID=6233 RepID=A0A7E4USA3_PANRE
MDGTQFSGWDLLQLNDSTDWVNSFSTLVENPHWTDIEAQLANDSVSTIFIYRKGYIPCWECGLYNCRINFELPKTDMEAFIRKIHNHPLIENAKVVGLYYIKRRQNMRFWLTGSDIDIPPIMAQIKSDIQQSAFLKHMFDPTWVSSKTKMPFRDYTQLPLERLGLDRTDPALFEIKISVPNYTVESRISYKLRNCVAQRNHLTIPLVSADLISKPLTLIVLADCRRRCEIYQKYEDLETMILITAELKRSVCKITQAKTVNAVITKNDAKKTMICKL